MSDFLLRNVPEDLHRQWAFFSKRGAYTMRKYLLIALQRQIERDKMGGRKDEGDQGDGKRGADGRTEKTSGVSEERIHSGTKNKEEER